MLADWRYAYAAAAALDGDHAAAADLFAQALEQEPGFAPAAFGFAVACEALERRGEARAGFAQSLLIAPDDELGAGLHLARLEGRAAPASPAYVAALFDQYAQSFDAHLVEALEYDGPGQLKAAVGTRRFSCVLDLGCGTGLAGAAFAAQAGTLAGVDLSARMVAGARSKRIYQRLVVGSIDEFLAGEPDASADLVLAADVAPYLGPLEPVMRQVARVLAPGGLFALTAQSGPEPISLGADLRFAHSAAYLAGAAKAAGLCLASLEPASIRRDRGLPVPGHVAVFARGATSGR